MGWVPTAKPALWGCWPFRTCVRAPCSLEKETTGQRAGEETRRGTDLIGLLGGGGPASDNRRPDLATPFAPRALSLFVAAKHFSSISVSDVLHENSSQEQAPACPWLSGHAVPSPVLFQGRLEPPGPASGGRPRPGWTSRRRSPWKRRVGAVKGGFCSVTSHRQERKPRPARAFQRFVNLLRKLQNQSVGGTVAGGLTGLCYCKIFLTSRPLSVSTGQRH